MFKKFLSITKRARVAAVASIAILGIAVPAIVAAPKALAYSTVCKTLYVSKSSITYSPHMYVPICYNGSRVWPNGGVTPGVTLIGYTNDGFQWYGTYQDGSQSWLGVGENMNLTAGLGPLSYTITCDPRFYINANGSMYSSTYGC